MSPFCRKNKFGPVIFVKARFVLIHANIVPYCEQNDFFLGSDLVTCLATSMVKTFHFKLFFFVDPNKQKIVCN